MRCPTHANGRRVSTPMHYVLLCYVCSARRLFRLRYVRVWVFSWLFPRTTIPTTHDENTDGTLAAAYRPVVPGNAVEKINKSLNRPRRPGVPACFLSDSAILFRFLSANHAPTVGRIDPSRRNGLYDKHTEFVFQNHFKHKTFVKIVFLVSDRMPAFGSRWRMFAQHKSMFTKIQYDIKEETSVVFV